MLPEPGRQQGRPPTTHPSFSRRQTAKRLRPLTGVLGGGPCFNATYVSTVRPAFVFDEIAEVAAILLCRLGTLPFPHPWGVSTTSSARPATA